jgi:hypothetical protein
VVDAAPPSEESRSAGRLLHHGKAGVREAALVRSCLVLSGRHLPDVAFVFNLVLERVITGIRMVP